MLKKSCILFFILTVLPVKSHAQIFDQACKETVWEYYKKGYASVKRPEGVKVFYYKIRFESEPSEYITEYQKSVDVKIYVSENQLHYITDNVSVYQDQQDAFMLIKNPQVIIRTNSGINTEQDQFQMIMKTFCDSVFATSRVIGCDYASNSKKEELLLVTIETGKKAMEAMNVERIVYQVNKTLDKIEKISMYYVRGYKYLKTVLTHLETDLDFKRKMNFPVKDIFFNSEGKIYDKYKAYRYIDNR